MRVSGRLPLGCSGYTVPALGPDPELFALKVLVGEEGPDPELFALKVLVCMSCCWSGTAGLHRPGNLLDSSKTGRRVTYIPGRQVHCRPPRRCGVAGLWKQLGRSCLNCWNCCALIGPARILSQ